MVDLWCWGLGWEMFRERGNCVLRRGLGLLAPPSRKDSASGVERAIGGMASAWEGLS
jgi:hypothetical protein